MTRVRFTALLESLTHGRSTYLVIRVPADESDLIDDLPVLRVGFQGVRVEATIGQTTWRTTVFPDKTGFLLLVARKRATAETLTVGDPVDVTLTVL
ncbi:MAG: DUF1905 domain-containing protein [Micrococcales bacterium]|nr:DUF1905 domain-containing protein [Micrococcales bacterium]MCL2667520.1 DUF1905 domain-containing protein [Micrococcales bacterium]